MITQIKKEIEDLEAEIHTKKIKLEELKASLEPDNNDVENIVDQL